MEVKKDETGDVAVKEKEEAESVGDEAADSTNISKADERREEEGEGEQDDAEVRRQDEDHRKLQQQKDVSELPPPDAEVLKKTESLSLEDPGLSRVDPAVIEFLTSGFVERFLQNLRRSQATLNQVRSSQEVLLETVQQEVTKFRDCQSVKEVEDTMVKARHYHNKLLRLRREMSNLHEKSKKLKKKALKLQQQKQMEQLTRAHTREHELEKERMLTARLATTPPSPSP